MTFTSSEDGRPVSGIAKQSVLASNRALRLECSSSRTSEQASTSCGWGGADLGQQASVPSTERFVGACNAAGRRNGLASPGIKSTAEAKRRYGFAGVLRSPSTRKRLRTARSPGGVPEKDRRGAPCSLPLA